MDCAAQQCWPDGPWRLSGVADDWRQGLDVRKAAPSGGPRLGGCCREKRTSQCITRGLLLYNHIPSQHTRLAPSQPFNSSPSTPVAMASGNVVVAWVGPRGCRVLMVRTVLS